MIPLMNQSLANQSQTCSFIPHPKFNSINMKSLATILLTLTLGLTATFAAEDDSPLTKEMKTMNKSLRTLKKQVADPAKKDDCLALIGTIKKSLEASAKLEPAKTKDIPAAEKAAYLDKYKSQMVDLTKTYDELEVAIKAGKADDAKKALDKLSEQKEKGHKDFAPDEK